MGCVVLQTNVMSSKKSFRPRSLSAPSTEKPKVARPSFMTPCKAPEKLTCSTCSRIFTSKLLFTKHEKEKSCAERAKKVLKKTTTISSTQKEKNIKVLCDECNEPFTSYRLLFRHRATSHSIKDSTSPKLNTNGEAKRKKTRMYAGLPANAKLQKAFAALKTHNILK